MMKMFIELDENKILGEGKYDLNKINAYIDSAFVKRKMKKDNKNWYINGNFTTCGSLILTLSQKDWFIDNVKQWLWYDADDESLEDLKAHYSKEATCNNLSVVFIYDLLNIPIWNICKKLPQFICNVQCKCYLGQRL